ncbi:glycine-rich domain-containing protein [Merismopedia glauca]|nr:glycine-rich domain-containing protein-like [Merismopedia glauca]
MIQTNFPELDRAFLERLAAIDFGAIAFKLMNAEDGDSWTLEMATWAIAQYRRFLVLTYLYPDEQIVPSREVDLVWHTHILDTAKYRADCNVLFGRFIDHWPYFGMTDEADRQALEDAFTTTQALLAKHFGDELVAKTEKNLSLS